MGTGWPGPSESSVGARASTDDSDRDVHGHDDEHPSEVRLTPAQRRAVGITVEALSPRPLGDAIHVPGEVRLNASATAQVTACIAAQVVERHARLGDHALARDPLVTLSSVEMAVAQGELVVADQEWQRVSKLGMQVLSERFTEAEVARQQARGRVLA